MIINNQKSPISCNMIGKIGRRHTILEKMLHECKDIECSRLGQ